MAGPFAGNGVVSAFPFTFKVFDEADLVVRLRRVGASADETLDLTADYTVYLNPDQDLAPGGYVYPSPVPAAGETLAISSLTPAVQSADITNTGGFYPEVIEQALDRVTVLAQELRALLARTPKTPLTSPIDPEMQILPGGILQWNGDGTGLIATALPDLGTSAQYPSQTGHAGEYLGTNGAVVGWAKFPYTAAQVVGATTFFLRDSAGTQLGGLYSGSDGTTGFLKAAGGFRFSVDATGTAKVYADGDSTGVALLTTATGVVTTDDILGIAAAFGA